MNQIRETATSLLHIRSVLKIYFSETGRYLDEEQLDAATFALFTMLSASQTPSNNLDVDDLMRNIKGEWEK